MAPKKKPAPVKEAPKDPATTEPKKKMTRAEALNAKPKN